MADANARYFYHCDGLGSVVALSDVNNVLVERYAYDVFGRPTIRDANGTEIAESACANPYLFTGRAYDAETALYYYRARYYDYFTGRFLQPDPIGYSDGLNLYTYVHNNAINYIDPFGHFTSMEVMVANLFSVLGDERSIARTAGLIYSEIASLRPAWCKGATTRTRADYDPASIQQLQAARIAIGHVYRNRQRAGRPGGRPTIPNEAQLRNDNTMYAFQGAVEAAIAVGLNENRAYDPTDGSQHFYLRTGGLGPNGIPNQQPRWATGMSPFQSNGPFRNPARVGDVPVSDQVYVDVYRGVR